MSFSKYWLLVKINICHLNICTGAWLRFLQGYLSSHGKTKDSKFSACQKVPQILPEGRRGDNLKLCSLHNNWPNGEMAKNNNIFSFSTSLPAKKSEPYSTFCSDGFVYFALRLHRSTGTALALFCIFSALL